MAESLFDYGNQAWADPVISSLLERSEIEALEALTAASPSLALLVLQKTGGIFSDSTGGKRLVWLLQNREDQCVPVRELRTLNSYVEIGPLLVGKVLASLISHPLTQPTLTALPSSFSTSSTLQSDPVLFERLAGLPALQFSKSLSTTEPALASLIASTQLTSLSVFYRHDPEITPPVLVSLTKHLRELRLTDWATWDETASQLEKVPNSLTSLTLDFDSLTWSSLGPISRLSALRSLFLQYLTRPENSVEAAPFVSALPHLKQLTELTLRSDPDNYAEIIPFRFFESSLPSSLVSLSIHGGRFSERDLGLLLSDSSLPRLETLRLESCTCPERSEKALPAFSSLKNLSVNYVDVSFLSCLTSLQTLSGVLFDTGLNQLPPSLKTLSVSEESELTSFNSISSLTNLTSLSLHAYYFSEEYTALSFDSLSSLKKLRSLTFHLSISLHKILDDASAFVSAVSPLTRLTYLQIFGNDAFYFGRARDESETAWLFKPVDFFTLLGSLSRLQVLHIGAQSLESPSWQTLPARFPDLSELALYAGESPESVPVHVRQALSALPSLQILSPFADSQLQNESFRGQQLKDFLSGAL